jgi:hypothetical protein
VQSTSTLQPVNESAITKNKMCLVLILNPCSVILNQLTTTCLTAITEPTHTALPWGFAKEWAALFSTVRFAATKACATTCPPYTRGTFLSGLSLLNLSDPEYSRFNNSTTDLNMITHFASRSNPNSRIKTKTLRGYHSAFSLNILV